MPQRAALIRREEPAHGDQGEAAPGPLEWAVPQPCPEEAGEAHSGGLLGAIPRLTANVKLSVLVLWLSTRDPRTPWMAKLLAGLAVAYVLSPVQLIPNFVPVVGCLDDFLAVTLCGWLALKLMPTDLITDLRAKARTIEAPPVSGKAAFVVVALWAGLSAFVWLAVWRLIGFRTHSWIGR